MRYNRKSGYILSERVTHRRILTIDELHEERLEAAAAWQGFRMSPLVQRRFSAYEEILQDLLHIDERQNSIVIEGWFEDWLVETRYNRGELVAEIAEFDVRVVSSTIQMNGLIWVMLEFLEVEGFGFEGIRTTYGEHMVLTHIPKGIN